ncbi:MAG TPA: hypothetical protein VGF67_29550 [Ktedonobacteraceae bacterium]|jgi:hypothetical protein
MQDREVHWPADLWQTILADALCGYAFRQFACWSVLHGIATISESVWCKQI